MSQFLEKFKAAGGDVEGVMDRFLSDEELLKDCLAQFANEDGFEQLKVSIEQKSYKEAFDHAHALKGITGNLGLLEIYNNLCKLVESLRGEHYDNLEEQLEAVLKSKEEFLVKYKDMQ